MSDHLYPARPGMLRVGALTSDGVVVSTYRDEAGVPAASVAVDRVSDEHGRYDDVRCVAVCDLRLNLRDVTARAHAAMPYTQVIDVVEIDRGWPDAILAAMDLPDDCFESDGHELTLHAYTMSRILARMRMLDESVTVEEARAALDWAHSVTAQTADKR